MDTVSSLDQERQRRPRDRGAQSGRRHFGARGHCSSVERVAPQSTQQLRPPGPPPGAGSRRAQTRRGPACAVEGLKTTPLVSYIYNRPLVSYIYNRPVTVFAVYQNVESRTSAAVWGVPGPRVAAWAAGAWAHNTRSLTSPTGSASTRAPTSPARRPGRVKRARPLAARVSSLIGQPFISQTRAPAATRHSRQLGCHGRDVARRNRGGTRESCNAQ